MMEKSESDYSPIMKETSQNTQTPDLCAAHFAVGEYCAEIGGFS